MVQNALKRLFQQSEEGAGKTPQPAKTFAAGGSVGLLHDRLRDELGLDWDDPIAAKK
ncbi:DUF2236 domain-containing protein [Erythrobacter sp. SD-21]|uniref:DUF2236 domain-containing protein n=1 Tax=Erythrobacter sp. SD-21 TaxID=161528 RepID=UPI0002F8F26E|nr:DUF2236 domain-containing protein [Erythrobacter sp. SD-21]